LLRQVASLRAAAVVLPIEEGGGVEASGGGRK